MSDHIEQLQQLAALRDEGVLTEAEFTEQKAQLLSQRQQTVTPDTPEREVLSRWGNRKQGWRAVGGKLVVTDRRIGFGPHAFDSALFGEQWQAPLEQIAQVDKAPANLGHLFAGGLRPRLRLVLNDGTEELFVVNKLDQTIEAINEAIGKSEQKAA